MALLYKFNDIISLSRAQVDVVTILDAIVGIAYSVSISAPAAPGFGTKTSSYVAIGGDTPSSIAQKLTAKLLNDQTLLSVAENGTQIVLVGPLALPFTITVPPIHQSLLVSQQPFSGRIAENLRVIDSREIWTKDPATGAPVDHTWVRAQVVGRADVVDLLSDEILTLVKAA